MSLWPFSACWVHRDYLLPFLVVVLVFAFFGSHFAEDKLLVLRPWSFQASICVSLVYLLSLVGRPSPFGPCPSGLFSGRPSCLVPCPSRPNPTGVFLLLVAMTRPAMHRTVTLRVGRIPEAVSQPELIRMLAERFGTWALLAVQFLPGMRVQLTFDSEEAKTLIECHSEIEVEGYPCQVVGEGGLGWNLFLSSISPMSWTMAWCRPKCRSLGKWGAFTTNCTLTPWFILGLV